MILVIGAEASGKRTFVESLGYTKKQMANGVLDDRAVLHHLQDLVAKDAENASDLLPALLEKDVVICNEVGSGVIPVVESERVAREATGRLCVQLAQRATAVVRLVCGIPSVIKGTL